MVYAPSTLQVTRLEFESVRNPTVWHMVWFCIVVQSTRIVRYGIIKGIQLGMPRMNQEGEQTLDLQHREEETTAWWGPVTVETLWEASHLRNKKLGDFEAFTYSCILPIGICGVVIAVLYACLVYVKNYLFSMLTHFPILFIDPPCCLIRLVPPASLICSSIHVYVAPWH